MYTNYSFFSNQHILIILIGLFFLPLFMILLHFSKKASRIFIYSLTSLFFLFYLLLCFSPDFLTNIYRDGINPINSILRWISFITFALIPFALFSKYKPYKNIVYVLGSVVSLYFLINVPAFKFNSSLSIYIFPNALNLIMLIGVTSLPFAIIVSSIIYEVRENAYRLTFNLRSIGFHALLLLCFALSFFPFNIFQFSTYLRTSQVFNFYAFGIWHLIITLVFSLVFVLFYFVTMKIKKENRSQFLAVLLYLLFVAFLGRAYYQVAFNNFIDITIFPIWSCSIAAPIMAIALLKNNKAFLHCAYLFFLPGLIVTNLTMSDYSGINLFDTLQMIFIYHHYHAMVVYIIVYASKCVSFDFRKYTKKACITMLCFFSIMFVLGQVCHIALHYNSDLTFFIDHIGGSFIQDYGLPANPAYVLRSPISAFTFLNKVVLTSFGLYIPPLYILGFLFAYAVFGAVTMIATLLIEKAIKKLFHSHKACNA